MAAEQVTQDVDVLIVGAGPTGLFAAYYAGFRGLSAAVVDALPEPGGQVTAMYPEKMINDVAGFPEVRGRELVDALVRQAAQYEPAYFLGRAALGLSEVDDQVTVTLGEQESVSTRAVLITAGLGEFTPRPLPAGEDWAGSGVVHFIPELGLHAGQDVVVVGGGDSAFDWALALHPVAGSVTLVHRRSRFRAQEGLVQRVRDLDVELIAPAEIAEIRGDDTGVGEVEVLVDQQDRRVLPAQTVVAALGFVADLGPIQEWGLELDKRTIPVDSRMRTSRSRIYAAGDVTSYPGKVKLIATGFGEAATAVNNIAVELDPAAHLFPGHSTNMG